MLLALAALILSPQEAATPPAEFFGFEPGADRQLAHWDDIVRYFHQIDGESNLLEVRTLGETTQGRPFILAILSEGDAEPDRLAAQALSQGATGEDGARTLAREARPIVMITCNIHSDEIASSQTAPVLAYELLTSRSALLHDAVVLLVPSVNPDGQAMVTEWYREHVGTDYEGGDMPWLYHEYAGHDNNRDWFMFNLVETRMVSEAYYRTWFPQVVVDHHQMWQTGARMWVPPYADPPNPNVHPLLWRWLDVFGGHMALRLEEAGREGVVYGELFTGWWPGTSIMTPWWHNQVGILTESASARIATPIFVDPGELGATEPRMNFPNPWRGGWWRLRDIIDNQLITSYAVIETAAREGEDLLIDSWRMSRDQIERGRGRGFLLPEPRDPAAQARLLEVLALAGVQLSTLTRDATVDGRTYPAGTYAIRLEQPRRAYIEDLFERQRYPSDQRPYDAAGWTLPLMMGVPTVEVTEAMPETTPAEPPEPFERGLISGEWLAIEDTTNDIARAVMRMHAAGVDVLRPGDGTLRFNAAGVESLVGLHVNFTVAPSPGEALRLHPARVGLYQGWTASMDEGWTRLLLEQNEIPYATIGNDRMRAGNLRDEFDVIILASMGRGEIVDGPGGDPPSMPEPYRGGIAGEGVDALKAFVQAGGTLMLLDGSTSLVMDWPIPVRGIDNRDGLACPGSILRVDLDTSNPIAWGMPEEAAVFFSDSAVFRTEVPRQGTDRAVVGRFPRRDILESGYLAGEERIAGRAALVEVSWGEGRIILYGFRPQFRCQTHGTYKLFFNPILHATAERIRLD